MIPVIFPLAFQIEVNGEIASTNVEPILNSINSIYGNVDILANSFVSVDGALSEKFQERSLEIQVSFTRPRWSSIGFEIRFSYTRSSSIDHSIICTLCVLMYLSRYFTRCSSAFFCASHPVLPVHQTVSI